MTRLEYTERRLKLSEAVLESLLALMHERHPAMRPALAHLLNAWREGVCKLDEKYYEGRTE